MTAKPLVTVFGSLHYDIMVDSPDRPRKGETLVKSHPFEGIIPNFERRFKETDSPAVREELAR